MLKVSSFVVFGTICLTQVDAQSQLLNDLKNLAFPGSAVNPSVQAQVPQQPVQPQVQVPAQQQQMAVNADGSFEEMDLLCLAGPQAQTWFNIQNKFRYVLPPDSAFMMMPKEQLEPVLYSVVEDLASISQQNQDTCGTGKLMIQLLSILTSDENGAAIGQQLATNEKMTSPILTLLLDIPWSAVQPGWPIFGMFAQMAMRRVQGNLNPVETDGLVTNELIQFSSAMNYAIINGDLKAIKELANAYLDTGSDGVQESPLAFVTALFAQAATANSTQEAKEMFQIAQGVIKRMLHNPADLDASMSTRWPLWGMAYLASLKAAE